MYIRDCGYGRSRRSRKRGWLIISICILIFGMSGITVRALAGQDTHTQEYRMVELEALDVTVQEPKTVEVETLLAAEAGTTVYETVAEDTLLVVIDPGHGGEDNGCARAGIDEKDINLQLSLLLRDKLEQMGYEVLLTREKDTGCSLEERVKLANDARGDIYVSIHQNACEETTEVSGIETWYSVSNCGEDSKRLARLIHSDVLLYTKEADRGLRESEELYVIRETQMPSCLIETGFLSNKEDREALLDTDYQTRIVEGIASGIDLFFHPKTMYLTFDDGPSPENTEKILDILKEKDIKATFFVIGENARRYPETVKRIVEEGHTIGIHCDNHDYNKLYKSVDSYVADFEQAYETVYGITGEKVRLFRFPGGSINAYNKKVYQDIIEEMTNRGFVYFDWNASLEDAVSKGASPENLIQNAKESTLGRKRIVLLAHDTVDNTALCLEELIEQFPEYRMEPLTAEVDPIQF